MELANVLSESEAKVLCGLIRKLRHELGMWKSDATRRELKESTGLSFKTIQRSIKKFGEFGVLWQWRGPYEVKQCFYNLYLPVPESALESFRQMRKKQLPKEAPSKSSDHKEEMQPPISTTESRPTALRSGMNVGDADMNDGSEEHTALGSENEIQALQEEMAVGIQNVLPIPSNRESLDPEVSALADKLEQAQRLNITGEFLISIGAIPLQIASDTDFEIDRDGLFRFLEERGANSLAGFRELVKTFSELKDFPPKIDLSMSERLQSLIEFKLHYFPIGQMWLLKNIHWNDCGHSVQDQDLRRNMLDFMIKNKIRTLDEVFRVAMKKHEEIKEERQKEAETRKTEGRAKRRQEMTEEELDLFKNNPRAWQRLICRGDPNDDSDGDDDEDEDEYSPVSALPRYGMPPR
jgi:hypothetical protein